MYIYGKIQIILMNLFQLLEQMEELDLKCKQLQKEEVEKMIDPSSYTGICSILAKEMAAKAEAVSEQMKNK